MCFGFERLTYELIFISFLLRISSFSSHRTGLYRECRAPILSTCPLVFHFRFAAHLALLKGC